MTEPRVCYRHPDRPAGVACQRCDRPICPSCMVQASVGFHCPECVKAQGSQKVLRSRAVFGSLRHQAAATHVIIAVNVAVFVLSLGLGGEASSGPSRFIANFGLLGPCVNDHEWYRIVTSGFLHAGFLHLALNMFVLYNVGPLLERFLGWRRFVLVYFVSLIGGSLGAVIVNPNVPTVGASGAIFGLFGALLVVFRSQRIDIWSSGLGLTIVINLIFTFTISQISKGGHVGGFVAGIVAGYCLIELPRRMRDRTTATAVSAALIPVLFAASLFAAHQYADTGVICRFIH